MRPEELLALCPSVLFLMDVAYCSKSQTPQNQNVTVLRENDTCIQLGCGPPISSDPQISADSYSSTSLSSFDGDHHEQKNGLSTGSIWGYAIVACATISAVGLVAVAIIPLMRKVFYNHLLQFLVALAIGSLAGDALLHLIPHALIPHDHDHNHDHDHDSHNSSDAETSRDVHQMERNAIWSGLTALGGIFLFFIVERSVGLYSEWRRIQKEQRNKPNPLTTLSETETMRNKQMEDPKKVVAKSSRHEAHQSCNEKLVMVHSSKDVQKLADDAVEEIHRNCDPDAVDSSLSWDHRRNVRGHEHSHIVPGSVSSVAWMVIIGDGFHNFADGLAIGSAFSTSFGDGLSTSVAVFCHELPHELGDFAMLLNAGMSAKQALVYNCVSSVLCFIGMACGVAVGNVAPSSQWIFAIIAGMFLYVALVDMLPEMRSVDPKKGENPLIHLTLQLAGMIMGISIMLVIALFEEDINLG